MTARTISEKILSAKAGRDVRAGDIAVCTVDRVLGTDASSPMAIDYFEEMGGDRLFDPSHVLFAFDHYAPPSSAKTAAFHDRVRAFARRQGAEVCDVGEGISFQLLAERGGALPGSLVVGADSHTVTAGALNLFATGVGSSDLAAAMLTGQIWLRVPESIKVTLVGARTAHLSPKDIALALVKAVGPDGANYKTLEFHGSALGALSLEERMVICNLCVETDAKAAIFPSDDATRGYLAGRRAGLGEPVTADADAGYASEVTLDLSRLSPRVALPHSPDNVVPVEEATGTPVHMVFLGTCTGGRVRDFHEALAALERGGGRVAPGVQLVVTPASREVAEALRADGTLAKFEALGATVTTVGCGACCGTSGVIPGDGMNVLSTANRNFKARMGNRSASIYLASPATCGASAATGRISDPRAGGAST
ncbi:MAG TPA: aconitase/3-isopropylmalate dehydratase large subunit family protein [Gemmatimonadaceae bacterium]